MSQCHRHRRHSGPDRGRRHNDSPQAQPEGPEVLAAIDDRQSSEDHLDGLACAHRRAMVSRTGRRRIAGERGRAGGPSCRGGPGSGRIRPRRAGAPGRSPGSWPLERPCRRYGAEVRAAPRPDRSRARSRCRANRPTRSRARSVALPPIQARSSRERRPGYGRIRPGDRGRSRCHRPRFLHRRFPSVTVPAAASTAGGRVVLTAAEQLVHRVRGLFGDRIDRVQSRC